jgi:phage terminase small subunit
MVPERGNKENVEKMSRGRHRQPDELKALRGNPGKRKLAKPGQNLPAVAKREPLVAPDFLTTEPEKKIFKLVVEDYLQGAIARPSDVNAYARYAVYLARWMAAKEFMNGIPSFVQVISNHGQRLARHPLIKDMLDFEKVLQSLEDRLGLNPVARQNIVRGLAALPPALGNLFGDDPQDENMPVDDAVEVGEGDDDPVGYLQRAAGPVPKH